MSTNNLTLKGEEGRKERGREGGKERGREERKKSKEGREREMCVSITLN